MVFTWARLDRNRLNRRDTILHNVHHSELSVFRLEATIHRRPVEKVSLGPIACRELQWLRNRCRGTLLKVTYQVRLLSSPEGLVA